MESSSKLVPIMKRGLYYIITIDGSDPQRMLLEDCYNEYDGLMCTFTATKKKEELDENERENVYAIVDQDVLRGIYMEKIGTIKSTA